MANRFNRSIREIRDIEKQPLHTNEQNDLLSDINDDVYVRLRRRYERITGLPALEKKFNNHLMDYNQFKDDTQQMLIYLNDVNERQDMMIDKLNTDVDVLYKKAKRLKDITDEHTEKLKTLTQQLSELDEYAHLNIEAAFGNIDGIFKTLQVIVDNDKQDKLQSEIDEVRKTLEAIKTDLEETQAIEDIKQLNQSLQNFYSVSCNLTRNVNGDLDRIYFDLYTPSEKIKKQINDGMFAISVKYLDENSQWKETSLEGASQNKINDNYYSLSIDIGKNKDDVNSLMLFELVPFDEKGNRQTPWYSIQVYLK